MKLNTIMIIKDLAGIALIAGILFTDVSNWWVILGIVIISGNYKEN